jgi:hypothetical protein
MEWGRAKASCYQQSSRKPPSGGREAVRRKCQETAASQHKSRRKFDVSGVSLAVDLQRYRKQVYKLETIFVFI